MNKLGLLFVLFVAVRKNAHYGETGAHWQENVRRNPSIEFGHCIVQVGLFCGGLEEEEPHLWLGAVRNLGQFSAWVSQYKPYL